MRAVFVELPMFARHRDRYLDEEGMRRLQNLLLANPLAGDVVEGTGGLRKLRFADPRRGKGKRGGLRVIYYWWAPGPQFWLFTLFDKNEVSDLDQDQRRILKDLVKNELEMRKPK